MRLVGRCRLRLSSGSPAAFGGGIPIFTVAANIRAGRDRPRVEVFAPHVCYCQRCGGFGRRSRRIRSALHMLCRWEHRLRSSVPKKVREVSATGATVIVPNPRYYGAGVRSWLDQWLYESANPNYRQCGRAAAVDGYTPRRVLNGGAGGPHDDRGRAGYLSEAPRARIGYRN